MDLFRPLSFASLINWIAVVPVIGPIVSMIAALWLLVVNVVTIRDVHKLSTGKAVMVVLIPIIIMLVLMFTLGIAILSLLFTGLQ